MCFQGFVYFRCGHQTIVEHECKQAEALEISFFLKIACPSYHSSSKRVDMGCGRGKFYCAETLDGRYLEQAHRIEDDLLQRIELVKHRFNEDILPAGQQARERLSHAGATKATEDKDPELQKLLAVREQFNKNLIFLHKKATLVNTCIRLAANVYQNSPRPPGNAPPTPEVVVEVMRILRQLAISMTNLDPSNPMNIPRIPSSEHATTRVSNLTSPHRATAQPPRPLSSLRQGSTIHQPLMQSFDVPRKAAENLNQRLAVQQSNLGNVQSLHQEKHTGEKEAWATSLPPGQIFREDSKRTTPPKLRSAKNAQDSSPQHTSTGVRRSARVRDKKINYAEDDSDQNSRESSPHKSDGSAFSPDKTDRIARLVKDGSSDRKTEDPADPQSNVFRSNEMLGSMPRDWRTRSGNKSPATLAGLHASHISQVPGFVTPENASHYDTQLQPPSQLSERTITATPISGWSQGTPPQLYAEVSKGYETSKNMLSGAIRTHPLERDHVGWPLATTKPPQYSTSSPFVGAGTSFPDYTQMRRSFDSGIILQPPTEQGNAISESTRSKRPLSMSSPVLPMNKRTRLSFPGFEFNEGIRDRSGPSAHDHASSPARPSHSGQVEQPDFRTILTSPLGAAFAPAVPRNLTALPDSFLITSAPGLTPTALPWQPHIDSPEASDISEQETVINASAMVQPTGNVPATASNAAVDFGRADDFANTGWAGLRRDGWGPTS